MFKTAYAKFVPLAITAVSLAAVIGGLRGP
jgi:hypothetical protein